MGEVISTHLAVDLVLLVLVYPLWLHHQECVVEQEYQQICVFGVWSASTFQRAFVYQFTILVAQMQVLFTWIGSVDVGCMINM